MTVTIFFSATLGIEV